MRLTQERYTDMFARRFVEQCAPVLSGIKPSAMFSNSYIECVGHTPYGAQILEHVTPELLLGAVEQVRAELADSDIHLEIMAWRSQTALAFVWRERLLRTFINMEPNATLLELEGYDVSSPESCVGLLRDRVLSFDAHPRDEFGRDRFPHEIGLVLGYPADDVIAFTRHRRAGLRMLGYWNVYTNVLRASRVFTLYDVSCAACLSRFGEGEPVGALVSDGGSDMPHELISAYGL